MSQSTDDSFEHLLELAEFCVRESFALRSFVEYLRVSDDPDEVIQKRLENWRAEIGVALGNPKLTDPSSAVFERIRVAQPQKRIESLQAALTQAYSFYWGDQSR